MLRFYFLPLLFLFNTVFGDTGLTTGLKCGDGKCAGDGIETCISCPIDCGKCKLESFQSCIKPGMFALTFDDGPTEYTDELLSILEKHNVKASFFVIGLQLNNPNYGAKLKSMYDAGHTVASHTYSHQVLTEMSDAGIRDEMKKTEELISKYINRRPLFMRCPRLFINDRVTATLNSLGYEPAQVNLDTYDWAVKDKNPNEIYDSIHRRVIGSNPKIDSFISLQHETTRPALGKIPEIIKLVKEKGYTFVTMETCRGYPSAYHDSDLKSKLVDNQNSTTSNSTTMTQESPKTSSNSSTKPSASKSKSLTTNISVLIALTILSLSLFNL